MLGVEPSHADAEHVEWDDWAIGPTDREHALGGFLLDPDGNSAEAVHTGREDRVPDGRVDHLWIRVRDPVASKRFYTTIAPHAGLRIGVDEPYRVRVIGEKLQLLADPRRAAAHGARPPHARANREPCWGSRAGRGIG